MNSTAISLPSRDLQTFRVGQVVNIVGIPDLQGFRIERISDSGVFGRNSDHEKGIVLSCRSPAHLAAQAVAVSPPTKPTRSTPPPTQTVAEIYGLVSYQKKSA